MKNLIALIFAISLLSACGQSSETRSSLMAASDTNSQKRWTLYQLLRGIGAFEKTGPLTGFGKTPKSCSAVLGSRIIASTLGDGYNVSTSSVEGRKFSALIDGPKYWMKVTGADGKKYTMTMRLNFIAARSVGLVNLNTRNPVYMEAEDGSIVLGLGSTVAEYVAEAAIHGIVDVWQLIAKPRSISIPVGPASPFGTGKAP